MKYRDPVAFRQALEERLKARAAQDPARLLRGRKRIAFDRLLARLVVVAPEGWLLKGGFALDLRVPGRARATKDVDLVWRGDADQLLDRLIEATEQQSDDFFVFAIERVGIPEDQFGGSHRFRVSASLASRAFETFPLDVGVRADDGLSTETLTTADLLGFAGIAPVAVEAVPIEIQIAEKLHAYTRTYEGGRRSTRAKDLVDLALISDFATLDAAKLDAAIRATFAERGTHLAPDELPAPPRDWNVQFRKLAETVGLPNDLETGAELAGEMVDPILAGAVPSGTWNPARRIWANISR